jgi:hypothetical protein
VEGVILNSVFSTVLRDSILWIPWRVQWVLDYLNCAGDSFVKARQVVNTRNVAKAGVSNLLFEFELQEKVQQRLHGLASDFGGIDEECVEIYSLQIFEGAEEGEMACFLGILAFVLWIWWSEWRVMGLRDEFALDKEIFSGNGCFCKSGSNIRLKAVFH